MTTCDCCLKAIPDGQVKSPYGLCCDCNEVWITLHDKAERGRDYVTHLLASVLCHSVKDICARKGCTASEHNSGLTNSCRATGATRPVNVRVARWALKTGRLEKPAGFEDCNVNGYAPDAPVLSPVEVKHVDPTPQPRKGGFTPGVKKGGSLALKTGEFCPRTPLPDTASPVAHSAVEATTPQPGAPSETASNIAADEPPANISAIEAMENMRGLVAGLGDWATSPSVRLDDFQEPTPDFETALAAVRSAKGQIDDAFARLNAAQAAYKMAGEALLRAGRVA